MDWFDGLFGGGSGVEGGVPQSFDYSSPVASTPSEALSGVGFGSSPGASSTPSGGGGNWWGDIMSGVGAGARVATPLLGLGATGLGLYSGIKGMQQAGETREETKAANAQQRQAGSVALGSGTALTNAGTSAMMGGPLPEGLEAQAQQWEDAYRAQVRNYLAKSGQGTSSAATQWEPYIKQQASIYRQQLAGGLLQPGSANLGVASGSAARSVGQGQATQTGIGSALELANKTLASLQAASGEPEKRPVA